jgi:hypothetical protein
MKQVSTQKSKLAYALFVEDNELNKIVVMFLNLLSTLEPKVSLCVCLTDCKYIFLKPQKHVSENSKNGSILLRDSRRMSYETAAILNQNLA